MMMTGNNKRYYYGGIKNEEKAARLYDKVAIIEHGIKAKTNFPYTKAQIEIILDAKLEEEEVE
jgi:hypothetical protein